MYQIISLYSDEVLTTCKSLDDAEKTVYLWRLEDRREGCYESFYEIRKIESKKKT